MDITRHARPTLPLDFVSVKSTTITLGLQLILWFDAVNELESELVLWAKQKKIVQNVAQSSLSTSLKCPAGVVAMNAAGMAILQINLHTFIS